MRKSVDVTVGDDGSWSENTFFAAEYGLLGTSRGCFCPIERGVLISERKESSSRSGFSYTGC